MLATFSTAVMALQQATRTVPAWRGQAATDFGH
jgi:hypothetical protein